MKQGISNFFYEIVPWNLVKPLNIKDTIWDGMDETKITLNINDVEENFSSKPSVIPSKSETSQK
jgi:hypothetical protein